MILAKVGDVSLDEKQPMVRVPLKSRNDAPDFEAGEIDWQARSFEENGSFGRNADDGGAQSDSGHCKTE